MSKSPTKAAYGTYSSHRQDGKARTRDRMLDAACDLVLANGIQAATVDQIVAIAGVSRPTFYAHFQSREDVFKVLRTTMIANLDEHYDALAAMPNPSKSDVCNWVAELIATCRKDRKLILTLIRSGPTSGAAFDARSYYDTVISRLAVTFIEFNKALKNEEKRIRSHLLLMQLEALIRYLSSEDKTNDDKIFYQIIGSDLFKFIRGDSQK